MIKSTILASALMLCGPAGSMPNAVVLGGTVSTAPATTSEAQVRTAPRPHHTERRTISEGHL